ncbi:MAG: NUDIX hydrolase [Opitutales bacterium]|nr:NUDIX hydrolase [Opitutales bacterium]
MSKKLPSKWDLQEDHLHSDCRIFEVHKRIFKRKSDGVVGDFFVLDTNDWVNVLAITPKSEIVLVRQFRYGTEEFSLEPPGGVIEQGEDPIIAGLRELEEETGYVGTNAKLIGTARPNAAILSNKCHFVLVENVKKTAELAFDEHEELVTELHKVQDLKAMVENGEITHSIGLSAIFRLLLHLGI